MTDRYADIEDGVVINVVRSDKRLRKSWMKSDTANIGDTYENELFVSSIPSTPIPSRMDKLLQTLTDKGVLTESDTEKI